MRKKGNMDLGKAITSAVLFGVFVIALVIMGVVNNNMAENSCTETGSAWNDTVGQCQNATDGAISTSLYNSAYNITQDGQTGFLNMSTLAPTLGTILVAIIIIGALIFMFKKKM